MPGPEWIEPIGVPPQEFNQGRDIVLGKDGDGSSDVHGLDSFFLYYSGVRPIRMMLK